MNPNDFRYMRDGKALASLSGSDASVLAPINNRGEGRDRALLLLHGFGSSPAVYRQLLPALTRYDALVCPILPGHGESITAFAKATAKDWLLSAESACEELLKQYDRVDVLGLSLGGLLACHLSQRFALHHLYLLAPALALKLPIPRALWWAKLLHHLGFRYLRNRAGNIYTNQHAELAYRQMPISSVIEILTLIHTCSFKPPACPTDVFLGRFDRVVNSTVVADYFASLPNATIHWLEQSAHVLPLDGDIVDLINCLNAKQ